MSYYLYNCHKCGQKSKIHWKSSKGVAHNQKCPKCGAIGKYWHKQLDIKNYQEPKVPDFCLAVVCYNPSLLEKFVKNLERFSIGTPADIYFVHNAFEVEGFEMNRGEPRSQEEVDRIREIIKNSSLKNKVLIERDNIGEDVGGQQFIFNLLKHKYKYFFFINESAPPLCDNWLKGFWDMFESNSKVVVLGPKLCEKADPKHKYILPTTYWGIRSSFGIKDFIWPPPINRAQSKAQEIELIYQQVVPKGYCMGQVGTGANLMHLNNMSSKATFQGDGGTVCQ
tara:strand:+ start:7111 stop:7953 length:843 start_codon:yes stop_codon:yes gene_type:complete